jgi:hypothetical protein
LAVGLSTIFVAITFAIDFISPTLFRHRMRYTTVFKALVQHPVGTLAFGFLFAMPPLVAGFFMKYYSPENWVWILSVLFFAEVLAIVWACVGGTWMAAKMWPEVKDTTKPWWGFQVVFWVGLLGMFTWNLLAFGAVGQSLYTKSPLFKSHYSLVEDSLKLEGFGLREVLAGKAQAGFTVDVLIQNPTGVDLVLEENRLEIRHDEDLVAITRLEPLRVPAGEEAIQTVGMELELSLDMVGKVKSFLDVEKWSATLYVEVREGMSFPLYLK